MKRYDCDIAVVGAGIVGIATAFYLKQFKSTSSVLLIDAEEPMSLTSAQSGENYRNWWPHPTMTAFTDRSIDLMEALSTQSNGLINMNRRGYALATRADNVDVLMAELVSGYAEFGGDTIRVRDSSSIESYQAPVSAEWQSAPDGVDVLQSQKLIRQVFPTYDKEVKTVIHIRRAGAIDAQQMGQFMLQRFTALGGQRISTEVSQIEKNNGFRLSTTQPELVVNSDLLVNAAGPFINDIARMLGDKLPVSNTLQQKIAFEDKAGVILRQMPFSIDLDAQLIDWTDDERQLLSESTEHNWLTQQMPGAIHCRPEGGDNGTWLKLGWAFNNDSTEPVHKPELMDAFPEIVLRGAARLNPSLKQYYGRTPRTMLHYGGYYTLTDENWPLIGKMDVDNAFVVGAMSGFGTMASCAAGDLCARTMLQMELPDYASALSPQRYKDSVLMAEIRALSQRGIL